MVHLLRRFAWALPVGSAMLMLAACGNSSTPTSASAVQTSAATVATSASDPSVLVSGVVVDSANRPVAHANVECMGTNVTCVRPLTQIISQDGPDDGVFTAANGSYAMVLTAPSANPVSLNAHALKYELQMQQVSFPDPGCTFDRCAVTVNFRLANQE